MAILRTKGRKWNRRKISERSTTVIIATTTTTNKQTNKQTNNNRQLTVWNCPFKLEIPGCLQI
jgi:hypothetical protein